MDKLEELKGKVAEMLKDTETFPYTSPIGLSHATGIRTGEQIAFKWVLDRITELQKNG